MCNIWHNLFFAFVYKALGVPIAAGVLYPWTGLLLSPIIVVASPFMWKKKNGAFFRLVKCTTSRPPWQAATGGTRHGEGYQQRG
jgi:hypothetical protein